jgi:selenium donor protein
MRPVYLDYNATTPIDPEVFQAMEPYLRDHFGNPSSNHPYGIINRKAVERARESIAGLLNCHPREIIFTSGGTESNNLAIKGIAYASRSKGNHIICSVIEHPSVMEVCRYLEKNGFSLSYIPVDQDGIIDPGTLEQAIRPGTILITVMHANNETGAIQPVTDISVIARKYRIPFHTDAAQSVGKIGTDVNILGVDLLSVAGHKCYGPKGIGALYVREGITIEKLIHGADHEFNRRAGTENVSQIVGLGKACEIAAAHLQEYSLKMKNTRDYLYQLLSERLPEIRWNADPEKCLPNTLHVSFPGLDAGLLIASLEKTAVSAGAACHSDQIQVSHVISAIQVPQDYAAGSLRFSTGRYTTKEEIETAAGEVIEKIMEITGGTKTVVAGSTVRLTHYTHGLGCACKLSQKELEKILLSIKPVIDKNVLADSRNCEDAAVYKINKTTALIQTIDFLTPMVDSPEDFGAIAAANALSDIYAMGGKPVFALNIVGFPVRRLPADVMSGILAGATIIANQAGIDILGGHSIENNEPLFGMVVTGFAHPDHILYNSGAQTGDALILTKPLGTGIITTAIKKDYADTPVREAAIRSMRQLNKDAAAIMSRFPVNACTDISGFGLLGHLIEMVTASNVSARISSDTLPLMPGIQELVNAGMIPGGTLNNMNHSDPQVRWEEHVPDPLKVIMNDAQTSGGLLISLPVKYAGELTELLHINSFPASAVIGEICRRDTLPVYVL